MGKFASIDIIIFLIYFVVVAAYGIYIYRKKKSDSGDSKDYFLAEGSLTWWAIGASLIASNISAEQFIGMSGNGFTVGVAIAAYEWMAAVALIVIAVWFIPIYLKNKIFTMPQFLKTRYNETTALIMAVFWLFLYVFVNLTSILYLGSIAISNLIGEEYFHIVMTALAVFAVMITLGGMKVIGFTDVIQVVVLIVGGLATTYIALTMVSEHFGMGKNVLAGFNKLMEVSPDHFKLLVPKPTEHSTQEQINNYLALPGYGMYVAGIWIVHLNYWGCNQYITQRALGANLQTARKGILFAGFLKLFMPIIVMLPGIAAYVLYQNGALQNEMAPGGKLVPDNAYSAILGFLPNGLKGLSVAALTAAIVASLAGKANSIATIFTMDIYNKYINKTASEKKQVNIGKMVIIVSIIVAIIFTWKDSLGIGGAGGFTFIQKYTGFISPGVFAMFLLGMFWKRTTGAAAIVGLLSGFLLSVFFNQFATTVLGPETWIYTAYKNADGIYEIPFLNCMGLAFVFTVILMILVSLTGPKINPKAFQIDKAMFKVEPTILVMIVITLLLVSAIYIRFWS